MHASTCISIQLAIPVWFKIVINTFTWIFKNESLLIKWADKHFTGLGFTQTHSQMSTHTYHTSSSAWIHNILSRFTFASLSVFSNGKNCYWNSVVSIETPFRLLLLEIRQLLITYGYNTAAAVSYHVKGFRSYKIHYPASFPLKLSRKSFGWKCFVAIFFCFLLENTCSWRVGYVRFVYSNDLTSWCTVS